MNTSLILLCAGQSSRLKLSIKKQWLRINENTPLWKYVLNKLQKAYNFKEIIIVGHSNEVKYMQNFLPINTNIQIVSGGDTRQQSIQNALSLVQNKYVCIHDSARMCINKKVLKRLFKAINKNSKIDCVAPYLGISDTIFYENNYLNRDNLKIIQTPQISKTSSLKKAISTSKDFTDESSSMKNIGLEIEYVKGSQKLHKITFAKDISKIKCLKKYLKSKSNSTKTGFGIDIHKFELDKQMVLGGVNIEHKYGCKAHSDGDVLIHSIIDAMLGAIGAGDIGEFFPDNDKQYKNANSVIFLEKINTFLNNVGFKITNIDITILTEQPKINPHKLAIKTNLAKILNLPLHLINIKATTNEKMGFIGRGEGIAVHSVVNVEHINIKELLKNK